MRKVILVALALAGACDDSLPGPYDQLPLDGDFVVGVGAPVHVVRDRYGVAHIDAATVGDAAFVQGYVMAHDRLPQMDILRRFGAGTLSELFGALDPGVIDTDLEMRMHRMRPLAQQAWDALQASDRAEDREVAQLLQRFADGVNAYAAAITTDANPTGAWTLDPNLLVSFDPARFTAWSPIDSLVLGRFQAFALSWSAPDEITLTELYQGLRQTFDAATAGEPAAFARRGLAKDLLRFTPVGQVPTIPGFPNVGTDTGSRSDGGASGRQRPAGSPLAAFAGAPRPTVPTALLTAARTFFRRGLHTGPLGALGPHAFMAPYAGSNNWAVGPMRTADGSAMLATDQHLQLPNPSIFYPTHLIIRDVAVDVIGVTFPGIPGVILGSNGHVAWSGTVSYHDANDVYLETLTPCAGGSCAAFAGAQVPVETFTETVQVGALGTITESFDATYEVVPHHGPIIPTIDPARHRLAPRTAGSALSVRYTGHQPTFEIRALWNLARAHTIDEGFRALADFSFGSQNWTMIDRAGAIGWTTHAIVPDRAPAAYAWNATTAPELAAPFFVLPGDGSAEWLAEPLSPRYIPHAIDPAAGVLVTANADPVGATFDNDPLNQAKADGSPLYVGVAYAAGVRHQRIAEMIAARGAVKLEDMMAVQHDTTSTMGARLTPHLRTLLAYLDAPAGAPADAAAYLGALATEDRARLVAARDLLTGWTFATPTGLLAGDAKGDAAATSLFNTWMHMFIERTLTDELAAIDFDVWRLDDNALARIVVGVLLAPTELVTSADTGEPIVCDALATAGPDDSCTKAALQALLDAMTHLASPAGFGTSDVMAWAWGDKHRLRIQPLFPNTALDLPGPGLPGFPRRGDNFVVNRADAGWDDLDFSQSADGPAQRFIAIAEPGALASETPLRVKWALPGGVIFDSRSPHYRDLLDDYYLPETHFDAPYLTAEIVRDAESRWRFR